MHVAFGARAHMLRNIHTCTQTVNLAQQIPLLADGDRQGSAVSCLVISVLTCGMLFRIAFFHVFGQFSKESYTHVPERKNTRTVWRASDNHRHTRACVRIAVVVKHVSARCIICCDILLGFGHSFSRRDPLRGVPFRDHDSRQIRGRFAADSRQIRTLLLPET